jgi:hypothetical protein
MHSASLRRQAPVQAVLPSLAPAFTRSRAAVALLLISFVPLLFRPVAGAQEREPGARVFTDTIDRQVPHSKVVFTNTPEESEQAGAAPETAKAETSSDDFDNSTPTPWWIENGQTVAEVQSLVEKDTARLIDIQVNSTGPYSFTVTAVENAGAYKKTSAWFYGKTAAQVNAMLAGNKTRLISLKAYEVSGNVEFAGITIANTGADFRTSWWYYDKTAAELQSLAKSNPTRRFIAIDSYSSAGSIAYTAIMVDNTGSNKVSSWWAAGTAEGGIPTLIKNNSARVTYISSAGAGKFNVVLEACGSTCPSWQWYAGQTFAQIQNAASQNGSRLVNLASYASGACTGSVCYAGAAINNSNAITTRVGNLIRAGGVEGTEGLYLEQVSGPAPGVLANLEDATQYEPASAIKALVNLYAMTQVQAGKIKLTAPVKHYTNGPESCPDPASVSGTESLGTAIREMMWHSDNARTRELTDLFGEPAITAYAHNKAGMLNTNLTEIIGCAYPKLDTLTLDDAGTMYAGVANQDLLNAEDRGIFYSNMAGRAQYESEGYDWTHVWDTDIPNIINQEAPAGTTAAQKQDYMNAMNVAYKAGNYIFCQIDCPSPGTYPVKEDIDIAGWFQLPFCTASGTIYAEYVWGIMFSNEPDAAFNLSTGVTSTSSPADHNFFAAKSELMREQIAAGMASCKGKSLKVMTYSPADLAFATTSVGANGGTKSVTITNNQATGVTGLSVSIFGDFTETNNCKSTLAAGASCTVNVTFTPTASGERTGAVVVTDNGNGQPQTIELTGAGS